MSASRQKGQVRGSIRIIGGKWRRRRIDLPESLALRPTPDRVRETLFNWLAPIMPGAVCLDLFAGSGALGFEALSRGAGRAVLVEHDSAAAAALELVREKFGAEAEILRADAREFLSQCAVASFDIVFVDPPYAQAVDDVLLALPRALKPGARIYLERKLDDQWPEAEPFVWQKLATAGAVRFGLATVD